MPGEMDSTDSRIIRSSLSKWVDCLDKRRPGLDSVAGGGGVVGTLEVSRCKRMMRQATWSSVSSRMTCSLSSASSLRRSTTER